VNIEEMVKAMDAIVAAAETENRSLTDEEVAKYEELERDLAKAHKTAEVRSRHAAYKTPVTTDIVVARGEVDEAEERAFEAYLRTGERSYELRAQSVGTDSAGGYLVPQGFRTKLTERMKAFGGIEAIAEVITTESGAPIEWPTVDDTANEGELVAEGAARTDGDDVAFGTVTLNAYKFTAAGPSGDPIKVSVELLQDAAFDIEAFLAKALGTRIARKKAGYHATGTGSSQPLGLVAPASTVAVNLASGNAITYAKLLDLIHALDPEYREGARFVFADSVLKAIRLLEDNNGRPLWLADGAGLQGIGGGSLLGYPVTVAPSMPDASGDAVPFMAFGRIDEAYIVRNVKDVTVLVDPYTYSKNGQVGFSAWARSDAKVQNENALVRMATFDTP
jgi:HK97 family phage major capsid protein